MAENNPVATPRKICPLLTTGTVKTSAVLAPGDAAGTTTLTPIQCLGPACQVWVHDARLNPETGECGLNLAALFSATTATQVAEMNNNLVTLGNLVTHVAQKMGFVAPTAPDAGAPQN